LECHDSGGHGQVIPKQLYENGSFDVIDVFSKLYQKHGQSISSMQECGVITIA
jgi:chaperonin GroEL (HSP60 family)